MVKNLVAGLFAVSILVPHLAVAADPVAIISLPIVYKQVGLKGMKNLPVYVDQDCGKYFRAVGTDGKFYIMAQHDNRCGMGFQQVAIKAGTDTYKRGEPIHQVRYRFLGILEGKGRDGFPTMVPALERVK